MRFLILGGTAWLGRTVAATALNRGHHVTCLARGSSGSVPDGATLQRSDRDRSGAYKAVAAEQWDVVVDVSRQPGQVRDAVAALKENAGTFVFISSGNVYRDTATPGEDETAPLLEPLAGDVMESMETYGEAKVACERHVVEGFGSDRSLIVRSGLIGGPGDTFGRTGYWPLRFARPAAPDGTVLVPDVPGLMTQVIDVRDLADWVVRAGETTVGGTFNAMGPAIALSEHLAIARAVAGHTGPIVSVSPESLTAHNVEPWAGERSLPLWLPYPEWAGFSARDSSAAIAAGMLTRPLEHTLADTLAWELSRESNGEVRRAGLSDADEIELLGELAAGRSVVGDVGR